MKKGEFPETKEEKSVYIFLVEMPRLNLKKKKRIFKIKPKSSFLEILNSPCSATGYKTGSFSEGEEVAPEKEAPGVCFPTQDPLLLFLLGPFPTYTQSLSLSTIFPQ